MSRHRPSAGRHRRGVTLWPVSAGLAGVAVTLVLALGYASGTLATGSGSPAAGGAAGGTVVPTASGSARPAAPLVPATAEGNLELLARLLPPDGKATYVSRPRPDDGLHEVIMAFDRGGTRSHIFVAVSKSDKPPPSPQGCDDEGNRYSHCSVLSNGAVTLLSGGQKCDLGSWVRVHRLDGTSVELSWVECAFYDLPQPSGPLLTDKVGQHLGQLSPSEAQLIAADEQWNVVMPAEIVEAGRRHYPNVPVAPKFAPVGR